MFLDPSKSGIGADKIREIADAIEILWPAAIQPLKTVKISQRLVVPRPAIRSIKTLGFSPFDKMQADN